MPETNRQRVRELFMEIADVAQPERAAALSRLCGSDAALRAEVEALLSAEARASGFMGQPSASMRKADADATLVAAPHELPGQMIGRYKLLEQIGEGGFGSVWMAEQREPVKRRVALKVIKLGMDTQQVIARF